MYKKKGVLKHVPGGTGGIITRDCWEFRLIEETPEEEQYFYADSASLFLKLSNFTTYFIDAVAL